MHPKGKDNLIKNNFILFVLFKTILMIKKNHFKLYLNILHELNNNLV